MQYLSNKCVRVEFIALSTVAIASTIELATNGSPVRLTSGTKKKKGKLNIFSELHS